MDRAAFFVDAGYVYAAGGLLTCGTKSRRGIELNVPDFVSKLHEMAETSKSVPPLLRTYWYDGAEHRVQTPEHRRISRLPNVKIRLGTLNSQGQQKGVDALIYRDLITLSHEKAICDAVLVSGDADLCEGVRAAQEQGVRVLVVGIDGVGTHNQSLDLVEEADEVITLSRSDLQGLFKKVLVHGQTANASKPVPPSMVAPLGSTNDTRVATAATTFAKTWLAGATAEEVSAMTKARPQIPVVIDAELLQAAEQAHGSPLRGNQHLRRTARSAFWQTIPGG